MTTVLVCDYCGHEVNEDAPGCCGEVHFHQETAVHCDGCDEPFAREDLSKVGPSFAVPEGLLCRKCMSGDEEERPDHKCSKRCECAADWAYEQMRDERL